MLELDSDLKFTLVDFVAPNIAEIIATHSGYFEDWSEGSPQWKPLLCEPVWMQGETPCLPLYDACKVVDCAIIEDDKIAMIIYEERSGKSHLIVLMPNSRRELSST